MTTTDYGEIQHNGQSDDGPGSDAGPGEKENDMDNDVMTTIWDCGTVF